jgi:hypothetical protein
MSKVRTFKMDHAGALRRFKRIVAALEECFIVEGWHENFDRETAARLIRYLEGQAAGKGPSGRLDRELVNFLERHGHGLGYVYWGSISGMVATVAAHSEAARAIKRKHSAA